MVKILGQARFTKDMAQTLLTYFSVYAGVDGVVSVELTDRGLWLINPHQPARQFLGLADYPEGADIALPSTATHRLSS